MTNKKNPLKIGIVGLGTVGCGVIKVLQTNGDLIALRAGRPIQVVGVSARNKTAKRAVDVSKYEWFESPFDLLEKVDVLVEMVGGSEGFAYELVTAALEAGKHVVTANKALLAHHGALLARIAEKNNVALMYEAAVAGGIPAIKAVRQSFAGNKFKAVYGILNGTANFILTQMRETGRSFEAVLKDAQKKGYAEADPSFDIDGIDAGHKIAIMAAIAFGVEPDFGAVHMKGISQLTNDDIEFAGDMGYRIKLLGIAKNYGGRVLQVVEPCLVPMESPFAAVDDVYNAIYYDCDFVETPLLTGLGAGASATASSVLSDLIDIARGMYVPTFGVPSQSLKKLFPMDQRETEGRYFLRLPVVDMAGVVADVAAILRDHDVSIESMLQHGHDPGQSVQVVMTTHKVLHESIMTACDLIARLNVVQDDICVLRIEDSL